MATKLGNLTQILVSIPNLEGKFLKYFLFEWNKLIFELKDELENYLFMKNKSKYFDLKQVS